MLVFVATHDAVCNVASYHRGSHDITPAAYADAYNAAIAVVRTVYSGPLVVDIPGWGQETDTAVSASPLITDQDIVYSTHLYPQAYNAVAGRYVSTGDIREMKEQSGRPCIVGEFGDIQPDPVGSWQCDVKAAVEAAKEAGYRAVYGWSWNGDGGSLNMVSPAWTSNPTASEYTVTAYAGPILDLMHPPGPPSEPPSAAPTSLPSSPPSDVPSALPSSLPSAQPSGQPSSDPSIQPTNQPSALPSAEPTSEPSYRPSCQPTVQPTQQPTT